MAAMVTTYFVDAAATSPGDGSSGAPFSSIQAAINAAANGDTINIRAGTYNENLNISKGLTFVGANGGIGGDGARGNEAVLTWTSGEAVSVTANSPVVFDGLSFVGKHVIVGSQPDLDVTFMNSKFDLVAGGNNGNNFYFSQPDVFTFTGNSVKVTGYTGAFFQPVGTDGDASQTVVTITGNSFTGVDGAYQAGDDNVVPVIANLSDVTGTVSGNTFTNVDIGVLVANGAGPLEISKNIFTDLHRDSSIPDIGFAAGVVFFVPEFSGPVTISENTFDGADAGIRTSNVPGTTVAGSIIVIDENIFKNVGNTLFQPVAGSLRATDSTIDGNKVPSFFQGGSDNDTFTATAQNDTIDGGAGMDMVVASAGTLSFINGKWTLTDGDGVDTLTNVETVTVGGAKYFLVDDTGGNGITSLQNAVNAAQTNDKIVVAPGDYTAEGRIKVVDKAIEISGALADISPRDEAGAWADAGDRTTIAGFQTLGTAGLILNGVALTGADQPSGPKGEEPFSGIQVLGSGGITVTNSTVSVAQKGYFSCGIEVGYVDGNVTIDKTVFSGFTGSPTDEPGTYSAYGVYLNTSDAVDRTVSITNSVFDLHNGGSADVRAYGIGIDGFENAGDLNVSGNTFGNLSYGLRVFDFGDTVKMQASYFGISGNTFTNSGEEGGNIQNYTKFVIATGENQSNGFSYNSFQVGTDVQTDDNGAILHDGEDTIEGTFKDDLIAGNSGDDTLYAIGGNDKIYGGAGSDKIVGGDGNDKIDGGAGIDTASGYAADAKISMVGGKWTVTSADGLDTDTLTGIEKIDFGKDSSDVLLVGEGGFATIQAAIDAAQAGDTILVAAGSYKENLTVDAAGLTIKNAGEAGSATIAGGVSIAAGANGVTVDGFTISGTVAGNEQSSVFVLASDAVIKNNTLTSDNEDGIGIVVGGGAGNADISNNGISGYFYGVYVNPGSGSASSVTDNKFTGNTEGLILEGGPSVDQVTGNTFTSSGTNDIRVSLRASGTTDLSEVIGKNLAFSGGEARAVNVRSSGYSTVTGTDNDDRIEVATVGQYEKLGIGVTFNGGAGNDTLIGGAGNDTLNGGVGDDTLNGGGGNDAAIHNVTSDGADEINLGEGVDTIYVGANETTQVRLTFTSADVGNGAALDGANAVNEDGGLAVHIQAENGSDGLTGPEARADDEGTTFLANKGVTFDVRDLPSGTQRGNAFISASLGTGAADTITGTGGADYINAGQGNDTVAGGVGNDFLVGGAGDDTLSGEGNDDTFIGGAGSDDMDGGAGSDTVIFEKSFSNYQVVRDGSRYTISDGTESDVVTNVETFSFAGKTISVVDDPDVIVTAKPLVTIDQTPVAFAETTTAGTEIADADATDQNTAAGDTIAFSISSGNGGGLFTIDAVTGQITLAVGKSLNFEVAQSYQLTVRATDGRGLFDEKTVDVNVTDINEGPTTSAPAPVTVAETLVSGTVITTVTATDPDAGGGNDAASPFENVAYSIVGGNAGGLFTIDATTGAVSLASGKSLNFEAAQSYQLTVRATDGGGLASDAGVTINVSDVNEKPVIAAQTTANASEALASGTVITTLSASDPVRAAAMTGRTPSKISPLPSLAATRLAFSRSTRRLARSRWLRARA